jgi:hypothetical protein
MIRKVILVFNLHKFFTEINTHLMIKHSRAEGVMFALFLTRHEQTDSFV